MNIQTQPSRGFIGLFCTLFAFFVCCNMYGAFNANEQEEAPVAVTAEGEADQSLVVNYTGNIGKYAIRMTLNYKTGLGTYYYTGKGAQNKLSLIMYKNDDFLKLVESNHKGQVTGVFEGHILSNGVYSGLFTAYTGTVSKFRLSPTY